MAKLAVTTTLLILGSASASAQDLAPDRPALPALSRTADDGALQIWHNPANLALDPDPSFGLIYAQPLAQDPLNPTPMSMAGAANLGPLGMGLAYQGGAETAAWWTMATGIGIPLGRSIAMGAQFGWQLPDGPNNNFISYDLGLGWRPLYWFGMSLVGYNIGGPAGHTGIEERVAAGGALRLWNGRLAIGGDYIQVTSPNPVVPAYAEGTLRFTPMKGMTVRMYGNQLGTVGGGIEFNLGESAIGTHVTMPTLDFGTPMAMGSIISADEEDAMFTPRRRVPEIVLDEAFPYQPTRTLFTPEGESYFHLLNRLRDAADTPRGKAIVLNVDRSPFSFAQTEEILAVLDRARENGKKVVVYLNEESGNSAYMLACGADLVLMHPAQQLFLVGLSAELMYYRGTLDMLGLEPQFARRAEYKSAAESITNTGSTAAQREQMDALLDAISDRMVSRIALGRKKDAAKIRELIDGGPYTAREAIENGLIDGTAFPDELTKRVRDHVGRTIFLDDEWRTEKQHAGWRPAREIALIYVDGMITSGPSTGPGLFGGSRTAGSETIVKQLETAEKERSVKAVVIRVDSPGGSAFGSDEIWRAVEKVKDAGKPVVVSMGGVAASGGYYVAAGADAVFAQPSTITGSIGVIGGKLNLEGLYEKIGVNYEIYNRGRNAAMFSMSKPFDAEEFAAFDRMIGDTYRLFTNKVALGRDMEQAEVEEVAKGRVWAGSAAHELNLVDELGGFHAALARARTEAGMNPDAPTDVVTFKEIGGPADLMARESVHAIRMMMFPRAAARNRIRPLELDILDQWTAMGDERIWTLMPYRMTVR